MAEYCPHHATCPFYSNWVEQKGDNRTDVILVERGTLSGPNYKCLTLIAIDDPETGIAMGDGLKKRLSYDKTPKQECSHITLLNK